VIKTIYTGSVESFATVVASAMGVPVLIAGERLADGEQAITKAVSAVEAGAAGVAYGRQIFARPQPVPFLAELRNALDKVTGSPTGSVPALMSNAGPNSRW
jgi:DhnA family fructose-bisphosphate aldolase class Ia